ncbi:hypothetical protein SAMN05892877_105364 [Rhizobium subbaraonis]|uniref:Uncharacterized protein n=1 Tax=Rhizobium subbaraonis TaxID=908946 RepID=A0A285UC58_9HYPH|nr:hypothetical protein [Rhizobium subbaraonis]SOC38988.1 hypothetical protein SAMN05892877_105364 [Rhizobium subbaraonis]
MINARPALFAHMGAAFDDAFGNVDAAFTIDGVQRPAVRAILRKWREIDLVDDLGQGVEGTTHLLSVAAGKVSGLESQRDSVIIHELDRNGVRTGVNAAFEIRDHSDDGRAMARIHLSGDI